MVRGGSGFSSAAAASGEKVDDLTLEPLDVLPPGRAQHLQAQHQRGDDPDVSGERPHIGVDELTDPRRRLLVGPGIGPVQVGQDPPQDADEQVVEQLLLGVVVVVHAGLGEARLPGHVGHGGAVEAPLGEDPARRLEHRRRFVVVIRRRGSCHRSPPDAATVCLRRAGRAPLKRPRPGPG